MGAKKSKPTPPPTPPLTPKHTGDIEPKELPMGALSGLQSFLFHPRTGHYGPQPICYTAAGGGHVYIPFPVNPWEILGLKSNKASQDEVKIAFREKIKQPERQKRALVSLANHILTSTEARYKRSPDSDLFTTIEDKVILKRDFSLAACGRDHFSVAAYGNTEELQVLVSRDESLVESSDEHGRTFLYLACKSGFFDMVKMLLQEGADINKVQKDGSTPLHAAAFFGHPLVVGLLLEYGARIDIKNRWNHTALEESDSTDITDLIQNFSSDYIFSLKIKLTEKKLISKMRPIEFKGQVIAKELIRNLETFDPKTYSRINSILEDWEIGWHGTQCKNIESILKNGLIPAGTREILPPNGHIRLGQSFLGISNWAAAIFLSPSITYAAHAAYSERVLSNGSRWCVVFKVYCQPGTYKTFDPTVLSYEGMEGEPTAPEYRIPVDEEDKEVILRVESARNVVVRSVIFIRASILENQDIIFKELEPLFRA